MNGRDNLKPLLTYLLIESPSWLRISNSAQANESAVYAPIVQFREEGIIPHYGDPQHFSVPEFLPRVKQTHNLIVAAELQNLCHDLGVSSCSQTYHLFHLSPNLCLVEVLSE